MARARPIRRTAHRDRPTTPVVVQPRLLRRVHAAAYLSLSPAQLDLLRTRGEIRPVPVPSDRSPDGVMRGAVLYDRLDLDHLIDRWKWKGADDAA